MIIILYLISRHLILYHSFILMTTVDISLCAFTFPSWWCTVTFVKFTLCMLDFFDVPQRCHTREISFDKYYIACNMLRLYILSGIVKLNHPRFIMCLLTKINFDKSVHDNLSVVCHVWKYNGFICLQFWYLLEINKHDLIKEHFRYFFIWIDLVNSTNFAR